MHSYSRSNFCLISSQLFAPNRAFLTISISHPIHKPFFVHTQCIYSVIASLYSPRANDTTICPAIRGLDYVRRITPTTHAQITEHRCHTSEWHANSFMPSCLSIKSIMAFLIVILFRFWMTIKPKYLGELSTLAKAKRSDLTNRLWDLVLCQHGAGLHLCAEPTRRQKISKYIC